MFPSFYFSTTREILPYAVSALFLIGICAWALNLWAIRRFGYWTGRAE
jgi:hypothetical protein